MNAEPNDAKELLRLCGLLVDEHLGETDSQRLSQLLGGDASARAFYRSYMDSHARLLLHYEPVPAVNETAEEPVDRVVVGLGSVQTQHWRLPWRWFAPIAAAACLLVALGVWQMWLAAAVQQVIQENPPPRENGDGPAPLPAVRLAAHWRITPAGKADYRVVEPTRVRLVRGELFVELIQERELGTRNDRTASLRIETPSGEAVATGTRFYIGSHRPTEKEESTMLSPLTRVLILSGVVTLTNAMGSVTGGPGELLAAEENAAPQKHVEDLTARFGEFYQPVVVDVEPSIPPYQLPLTPGKVSNWRPAVQRLGLGKDALAKLQQNGFVVVPRFGDDIVAPYKTIQKQDVPIFVTADTLLHLYHVQFDESLKDIEEREFYPDMLTLTQMMVGQLQATEGKLAGNATTAAARLNLGSVHKAYVYAAIGLKCLDPDWEVPAPIAADVATVIDKMEKHEGFWPDPRVASQQWPLFRYAEDFSQYVPRGHYTRSEELKRYFKGMMWFGRMAFILKGEEPYGPYDQPALVSPKEAQLQTMAATHLAGLLSSGILADGRNARFVWERIYTVTAFYVGLADDLGLDEYEASVQKIVGASMNVAALADQGKFRDVQAELAKYRPPAIYGGTGAQGTYFGPNPDKLIEALDKSTGFRLMGQRYIPDSYMMGKLVTPTVGKPNNGRTDMFTCVVTDDGPYRCFPRGLDVMAVLGSHRAEHWLAELGDDAYGTGTDLKKDRNLRYDVVLNDLKREFSELSPSNWNRNIYWSWLYALKPLLANYGEGYPTFMTTDAWHDKSMNTALASWSQLRHDTILYAKQSYTMVMTTSAGPPRPKPVEGYVEPAAEFYARMSTTTRMTLAGLKAMEVLQPQAIERLEKLDGVIARLLEITKKELANKELTKQDYAYIRNFGKALEGIRVKDPLLQAQIKEASDKKDFNRVRELYAKLREDKSMKTTIIADVHTDSNSEQCLEEGTGNVEMIVACYLQPDGRLVLGAGPVLSYYEFKHPMRDRMTDEKWRQMLKGGEAPEQPEWVLGYRSAEPPKKGPGRKAPPRRKRPR